MWCDLMIGNATNKYVNQFQPQPDFREMWWFLDFSEVNEESLENLYSNRTTLHPKSLTLSHRILR